MEHVVCFGKHPTVLKYRHIWNYKKCDWSVKGKRTTQTAESSCKRKCQVSVTTGVFSAGQHHKEDFWQCFHAFLNPWNTSVKCHRWKHQIPIPFNIQRPSWTQPQTTLSEHLRIAAGLQMGAQTCLNQSNTSLRQEKWKLPTPQSASNFCYIKVGEAFLILPHQWPEEDQSSTVTYNFNF